MEHIDACVQAGTATQEAAFVIAESWVTCDLPVDLSQLVASSPLASIALLPAHALRPANPEPVAQRLSEVEVLSGHRVADRDHPLAPAALQRARGEVAAGLKALEASGNFARCSLVIQQVSCDHKLLQLQMRIDQMWQPGG